MDLRLRLSESRQRRQAAADRLRARMANLLIPYRSRVDSLNAQLKQLSPLNVLDRGYAIVQDNEGHVIKDASAAQAESDLLIRLAKGRLQARVISVL
jgi:exodeoxyribonuclease VII large subunit